MAPAGEWAAHYPVLRSGSGVGASNGEDCLAKGVPAGENSAGDASGGKVPPRRVQQMESEAVYGVTLNLTRTIVGSAILCLPFALQEGGAGLGIVSLVATGAFSLGGFLAIGMACEATGAQTYREAWHRTVGTWPMLVDIVILFECIITCVGYVILILDYLLTGLQGLAGLQATESTRNRLATLVTVSCLIPLCLRPHMDSLKFSSLCGNVAMLYTMAYVILECISGTEHHTFEEEMTFVAPEREGVFRAMCVMTSAYVAHYSAPDFMKQISAKHTKPWRGFRRATMASFGIALVAYGLFAFAGYERFGSNVLGNVLLNYDGTLCVLFAWVSMAATLIASFPLIFKPARDTVAQVLALDSPAGVEERGNKSLPGPWTLMTVLVVVVTVLAGVVFRDISRILAFRGAILGCPVSFILPGLMLLHCPSDGTGSKHTVHAWALILFGVFAGTLGLYCTVRS